MTNGFLPVWTRDVIQVLALVLMLAAVPLLVTLYYVLTRKTQAAQDFLQISKQYLVLVHGASKDTTRAVETKGNETQQVVGMKAEEIKQQIQAHAPGNGV